ncbi:MAG: hypothetical protein R3C01_00355 [Planctomycetaceae bacterium]
MVAHFPLLSSRRHLPLWVTVAICLFSSCAGAQELPRGFAKHLPAISSGEERNRQSDLRIMEVQFKPMRMTIVDMKDHKTGQMVKKEVWYLVYRCITRPSEGRIDNTDTVPVNAIENPPRTPMFAPEFVLTVYDDPKTPIPTETHFDQVIPEAVLAVRGIEERPAGLFVIKDSLEIVQDFPSATDPEALPEDQKWLYGVATFTDIDPETDYFMVSMRGFTNAFEMRNDPDGNPIPWRKTVTQKYTRLGDRFDPTQREFGFDGDPEWGYQPDSDAVRKVIAPIIEQTAPSTPIASP